MKASPEALEIIGTAAKQGADAVVGAIEREARRRRDNACFEETAMGLRLKRNRARLAALPKARLLARAIAGIRVLVARRRHDAASDYCAAVGSER